MTFANIHIKVLRELAVLEPDGGTTVGEESGARCDNTVVGTFRNIDQRNKLVLLLTSVLLLLLLLLL